MAYPLQHETSTLGTWLPTASSSHYRTKSNPSRREVTHAITSHIVWYKISGRPEPSLHRLLLDLGSGQPISAARMKAGHEHRIPLTARGMTILKSLKNQPHNEHVFPGNARGEPLPSMAMSMLLRRMNRTEITVHGFRSTFRELGVRKNLLSP